MIGFLPFENQGTLFFLSFLNVLHIVYLTVFRDINNSDYFWNK